MLVAGGLGERLGFSGIKVALPYQISTGDCYLQLYIGSILALQRRAAEATGKPVQLHGQIDPLAVLQLGSCASSGRTRQLWAARHSQGAVRAACQP